MMDSAGGVLSVGNPERELVMSESAFVCLEGQDVDRAVETMISSLSLDQKIGQMLTFEFCGTRVTPDVVRALREYHCGGLRITPHIYTALPYGVRHRVGNEDVQRLSPYAGPVEYASLLVELQRLAAERPGAVPLLISSDQEGDWSQDYARGGVNLFASPMGLSATGDVDLVYQAYRAVARQQRAAGICMLHTPCLDVNTEPNNPEIGTRSFSDDPHRCADYALAQLRGFRDEGVVATGKHFPGRGDSAVDVHFHMDHFGGDRARMDAVELVPYRRLIAEGLPAVMTAHTIYPCLDETYPASVSRKIIQGLLRDDMGFDGVVTTDAMGMKGVVDMFDSFGEACAAALAAGNDLVLAKGDPTLQPTIIQAVHEYLETGKITTAQIDDSVRRILRVKVQYRMDELRTHNPADALDAIRQPEVIEVCDRSSRACLTVVRDEENLLPIRPDAKVFVTDQHNWPYHNKAADSFWHSHMLPEFLRERASDPLVVEDWETDLQTTEEDLRICLDAAERADVIVVLTYFWRSSASNTDLLRLLIDTGKPVITISNCPYAHVSIDEAKTLILTYSCTPRSLEAAADVIYGRWTPAGGDWPLKHYTIRGVETS